MKVKIFWVVVLTLGFLVAVSCNQGPIFYTISTETPPLPPLISGSPTNMVVFNRVVPDPNDPAKTIEVPVLCVASGSLYWYAKKNYGTGDAVWKSKECSIPQPGGKIIALAVAGNYLYALCITDHNVSTVLKRIKNDAKKADKWEKVRSEAGGYPLIQSIYADPESEPGSPGRLFAGARQNSSTREVYAVLYLDNPDTDDPVLKILIRDTAILSGAAFREGSHYLGTNGGGIFRVTDEDIKAGTFGEISPLPDGSDGTKNDSRHFMGMIKLKDNDETIIAVERKEGNFYKINEDSFERMTYSSGNVIETGRYATGALALWENTDTSDPPITTKLLIAGIQGGLYNTTTVSYTYGYVEFDLKEGGSLDEDSFRREQGSLKSVADKNRYTATIGKHSLNHLFQAPPEVDTKRTFFASTQIAGLWSYRDRKDGGWQWNAEN
jgi:hypothetical protein